MKTLWKRETALHPTFARINQCLQDDWFLLPFELTLQRAHARALEAAGLLTSAEHSALLRGLDDIEQEYAGAPCPASDAEDLHTWIEHTLTEQVGDAGRKIHTARSRNDQVATLLAMYVIHAGGGLSAALADLVRLICRRANEWADLACVLHTHQQFAAPGNVGFWALRFATAFDRVRRHLRYCVGQWRRYCPLGSGAVAGSSIPIDRGIQATELGFEGPSLNALDATSTRDQYLEWLALAAQVALHLQVLAADVLLFSQTPLGWTRYPDTFATGSSMMPNKSNPDAMELLRGECCEILTAHAHALTLLKGLPSGYNRDLQCIKPVLHRTVERLAACTELTSAFLGALEWDADRLAASLEQGDVGATLRMESRVLEGKPLRDAHHAVATGSDRTVAAEPDLSAEPASERSTEPGSDFSGVARYATAGSASPAETRRVAAHLLASLNDETAD